MGDVEPETAPQIIYYFDEYPVDNHCNCSSTVSADISFNTQVLSKIYGLELNDNELSDDDKKKYGMITLSDFGNEAIQDWINMLVGLAFEQELDGETPVTDSHGPQGASPELYYRVKSMYLVLLSKKDEVVQCHAYKLNTGALEDAIIGYRAEMKDGVAVITKAGVCDKRNKLLLGVNRWTESNGTVRYKIIIPPKSFFLEGRHENVYVKVDNMNLINGYDMKPQSVVATLPTGVPGN